MGKHRPQSVQAQTDHLSQGTAAERAERRAAGQEDLAVGRTWAHFLEVAEDGFADGSRQRVGPDVLRLAARHGEQFVLPVEVLQPQAADLPGSEPVDGQEHQQGTVADVRRPVSIGRRDQPPDVVPRRAGWKGLVSKDTRRLDRGGQAGAAPPWDSA